jgi:hypothetical protein
MSACIEMFENDFLFGEELIFYGQNKKYHPHLERFTLMDCDMFLAKEISVSPKEANKRNQHGTFAVNFHSELYDIDEFRVLKGPAVMFGIDTHSKEVLNHAELEVIARQLENHMFQAINQYGYSLDISVEEGIRIKQMILG